MASNQANFARQLRRRGYVSIVVGLACVWIGLMGMDGNNPMNPFSGVVDAFRMAKFFPLSLLAGGSLFVICGIAILRKQIWATYVELILAGIAFLSGVIMFFKNEGDPVPKMVVFVALMLVWKAEESRRLMNCKSEP